LIRFDVMSSWVEQLRDFLRLPKAAHLIVALRRSIVEMEESFLGEFESPNTLPSTINQTADEGQTEDQNDEESPKTSPTVEKGKARADGPSVDQPSAPTAEVVLPKDQPLHKLGQVQNDPEVMFFLFFATSVYR
jgi:hypothetical protein